MSWHWYVLFGVGLLILAIALVWSRRQEPFDVGELDIYPDIYPADPWSELLKDPEFMASMERAKADAKAGRVYVRDASGEWVKGPDWPKDEAA